MRAPSFALICMFCGSASAEELVPPPSLMSDHWSNILLIFFSLMCVVAVWFVWRQRKVANTGFDYRLQIVGGVSFGPKERLVLVKIKDRLLLVGVTAHQVNLIKDLHEMDFLTAPDSSATLTGSQETKNTENTENTKKAIIKNS
jgi:flagellar protein FliO/FliZ